MSDVMEGDIKRWTARRKATLVPEIIQRKTRVAAASCSFDLPPSEIEEWVDEGKRGMENALQTKPPKIGEEYARGLKELQEAYGEGCWSCVPENNCSPCWARRRSDRDDPPGTLSRRHHRLCGCSPTCTMSLCFAPGAHTKRSRLTIVF